MSYYSDFTVGKRFDAIAQGELFVVNDFLCLRSERGPIELWPGVAPYLVEDIVAKRWPTRVHRDGAIEWHTEDVHMQPRRLSFIAAGVLYNIGGCLFLGVQTDRNQGGIALVDVKTGRFPDTRAPLDAGDTLHWSIRQIADGKVFFKFSK